MGMRQIPIRNVLAISAVAIVLFAAYLKGIARSEPTTTQGIPAQEEVIVDWDLETPAPPPSSFLLTFLVVPGFFTALHLFIPASVLGPEWLGLVSIAPGVGFFWFCVGWYVDRSRGLRPDKVPAWLATYMRILRWLSVVLFVLGLLAGLRLGDHWGGPPYWSLVVMYGIFMTWASIGMFFCYREWQRRKMRLACAGILDR